MFQGFLCIFFLHVLFACCFHPGTSSHLGYRTNFSVAGLEFESKSQCVPRLCHRTFGMTSSCFMACKDSPNIYGFQGFVFGCFLFLYEYGGRFYINKYARQANSFSTLRVYISAHPHWMQWLFPLGILHEWLLKWARMGISQTKAIWPTPFFPSIVRNVFISSTHWMRNRYA